MKKSHPPSTRALPRVLLGLTLGLSLFSLPSCVTVAPYARVQLNDADMKLAAELEETFEHNVESYREGATGANGGKTGGGCGCN